MKKCPHCGKKLPQEMQFCPYCMEKLIPETPVGEIPLRRHRRRWLWLMAVLLLLLLLCGLWLWRPWRDTAPDKESGAPPFSEVTTTVTTTVDAPASATTSASQTRTSTVAGNADVPRTTTTKNVTTSYTTTSAGTTAQTQTPSRTTAATTAPALCGQGHSWEPITETVHVDEVGHYETKTVEKRVTVFRCALCYQEHLAMEDYYAHFDAEHGGDALQGIFRDRYTETEEYREVEEKTWVVDTPAHDQTVTVGRRCRVCGKTENNDDKE